MKTVPTLTRKSDWIDTLARLTLANGGASLYANGIDPARLAEYPAARIGRYFVAICETCAATIPFFNRNRDQKPIPVTPTVDNIATQIRRWYGLLTHDHPGTFIGTWLDDGRLYLDIVLPVTHLDDALALARATNQKAIYDAIDDEVINV